MREARARGFALSLGRATFGAGIVCVGIPPTGSGPPMGFGVGGLSAMIERDQRDILASIRTRAAAASIILAGTTDRMSSQEVPVRGAPLKPSSGEAA